jgi:hypothetical protein
MWICVCVHVLESGHSNALRGIHARGRPPYPIYRRGHAAPQEELEEERAPPDAEALERRRLRDAEEWRLKQLRAGVSAADNSNFQARARRSVHRCGRCRKGAALCHVSGF